MHLIHIISNEVTLETVVNAILASGGRAICANAPEEAAEITAISDALVLNIGIPSARKLDAMLLAGHMANELGIPVVLDPVGVGASNFRKQAVRKLLGEIQFACVRGNAAEIAGISAMYGIPQDVPQSSNVRERGSGVDSGSAKTDQRALEQLARRLGAVVVATGAVNLVSDGKRFCEVTGGSEMLTKMTGGGCILSGLLGLFLSETKARKTQISDDRLNVQRSASEGTREREFGRESVYDAAHESGCTALHFQKVCDCLAYYRDCAREAERIVLKDGRGVGFFPQALIDAMARSHGVQQMCDSSWESKGGNEFESK